MGAVFAAAGFDVPPAPWPRMRYDEAMLRFGSDRPDTRFGLEIVDVGEALRGSRVQGLRAGARRRRRRARDQRRRARDVALGARRAQRGRPAPRRQGGRVGVRRGTARWRSPIAKFLAASDARRSTAELRRGPGDLLLFVADQPRRSRPTALGGLRLELGPALRPHPRGRPRRPAGSSTSRCSSGPRRAALGRAAPPVHGADGRLRATRARCARAPTTSSSTAASSAAGRSVSHARGPEQVFKVIGMSEEEARRRFGFLLDALQLRRAAARRHRLGLDRDRRDARRPRLDPRRHRLPEDGLRRRPADRRAGPRRRPPAARARGPFDRRSGLVAGSRIGPSCRQGEAWTRSVFPSASSSSCFLALRRPVVRRPAAQARDAEPPPTARRHDRARREPAWPARGQGQGGASPPRTPPRRAARPRPTRSAARPPPPSLGQRRRAGRHRRSRSAAARHPAKPSLADDAAPGDPVASAARLGRRRQGRRPALLEQEGLRRSRHPPGPALRSTCTTARSSPAPCRSTTSAATRPITRGARSLESPTVARHRRRRQGPRDHRLRQAREIDQAVSDIGGKGFAAQKAFHFTGFAKVADDTCKDLGYALDQKVDPPTTVPALSKALGIGRRGGRQLAQAAWPRSRRRRRRSASSRRRLVAFDGQGHQVDRRRAAQLKAGAEPRDVFLTSASSSTTATTPTVAAAKKLHVRSCYADADRATARPTLAGCPTSASRSTCAIPPGAATCPRP